jgi:uncharacterized lipoprotein YajG
MIPIMKKALFSLAAIMLLTGCAAQQCVQPDPVDNSGALQPMNK